MTEVAVSSDKGTLKKKKKANCVCENRINVKFFLDLNREIILDTSICIK